MFLKRRRKIFVNRTKKEERRAITDSLKRLMGAAYYEPSAIRLKEVN